MKAIKYILGSLCMISMASCQGFLEEVPKSNITDKNYYTTEQDAEGSINAIYETVGIGSVAFWQGTGNANTTYGGVFYNEYYLLQDLLSDNAMHDDFRYANLDNFSVDEKDGIVSALWYTFYRSINTANVAIQRIPEIEMDEVKRNHLIAEAKFWRGLLYGELVKLWGPVPHKLTPSESISELSEVVNGDPLQILTTALDDLKYAEENLTNNYRQGYGRASVTMAQAVAAKVALIKAYYTKEAADYTLVAEKCKAVIGSNEYDLYDSYQDNFVIAKKHGIESIVSINYETSGLWGSQFNVSLLPIDIRKKSPSGAEGPDNANYWVVPTTDLYESYTEGDTRRDITIMKDYTYSDGSKIVFADDAKYPYYYTKYWDRVAEPEGQNSGQNYPYMRYSEILLMYAEALNELNDGPDAEALKAINKVRDRAFQDAGSGLHNLAAMSKIQFRKAILDERRWEFAMEGSRWFDLVRLSDNFENTIKNAKPQSYVSEKHKLLPIPLYERQLNDKIQQNAGY